MSSLRITFLVVVLGLAACGSDDSPWGLGIGGKGELNPGEEISKGTLLVRQAVSTKLDRSLGVNGSFACLEQEIPFENGIFYVLRGMSEKLYPIEMNGEIISKYEMGIEYPFPVGEYTLIVNNTRLRWVIVKANEEVEVHAGRIEQPEGAYFTIGGNQHCDRVERPKVPTTHGIDVLPGDIDPLKSTDYFKNIYGTEDQLLGEITVQIANKP